MNNYIPGRTRRQLFRFAAAAAAYIPFQCAPRSSTAKEKDDDNENRRRRNWGWDRDLWPDRWNGPYDDSINCFLKGTRISVPMGEALVEDLEVDDEICTLDGLKRIKWIGKKKLDLSESKGGVPVRIARFAIDDQTPFRDLYLSPAHCLFLNEVLIPVGHLINDVGIVPCVPTGLDTIEYFHIEFDTHEVIFAEGACVESYLGSNRETFANFEDFERIYGVEQHSNKTPYAPIAGYFGGRDEAIGLIRSFVSHVIDVRDPIQIAWDHFAARTSGAQTSMP